MHKQIRLGINRFHKLWFMFKEKAAAHERFAHMKSALIILTQLDSH